MFLVFKIPNGILLYILLLILLSAMTSAFALSVVPEIEVKIAIIIDDCYGTAAGMEEMLKVPAPLTLAFLPYGENNLSIIEKANTLGHEVFVHLPMEPNKGKASWLGPDPIVVNLSDDEIKSRTRKAIEHVPYAIGINNHMGSKATSDDRVMLAVMEVVKEKDLIFVDSKTSPNSKIPSTAVECGVTYFERDVFLEHTGRDKESIKKQIRLLINKAIKEGKAIAIGHVGVEGGKVTAEAISEMLTEISRKGIMIVKVSQLK